MLAPHIASEGLEGGFRYGDAQTDDARLVLRLIREAVREATRTRLRPVMMSTITTVFGLSPLVLLPGAGAELYRGLGSVVVGGLIVVFLVRTFAPEAKGHGVPEVMVAVITRNSVIRPVVVLVKTLASALSIASGGSLLSWSGRKINPMALS